MSSEANQVPSFNESESASSDQNRNAMSAVDGGDAAHELEDGFPGSTEPEDVQAPETNGSHTGRNDANANADGQGTIGPSATYMAASQGAEETRRSADSDGPGAFNGNQNGSGEHQALVIAQNDAIAAMPADVDETLAGPHHENLGAGHQLAAVSTDAVETMHEFTQDISLSPDVADDQDVSSTREHSLAAEPSLAHHASAVCPGESKNGPYVQITVQVQQSGETGTMVLDVPEDNTSAAGIVDMLARRLNKQPGAVEIKIAGQQFSGGMVLPSNTDGAGDIPIVAHIRQSSTDDTVDLSAPATPVQLQVVVCV